jgi:thiamine biosynthesis lipoprotein
MPLFRLSFRAMASPCEVQLRCDDARAADDALRAAADEVRRIEAKYSRYRDDSVVAAINRNAGGAPVAVDDETAALLDFAAACHRDSAGLFDVTSGVLRRAWDFKSNRLPERAALDALLPLIGWDRVERRDRAIRLPREGMELDFGGFGKEYAADRALAVLQARIGAADGSCHALVNLGGDVRVATAVPSRPWRIGIQHPRRLDAVLAHVALDAGALATSGDYERYLEIDGRRYAHVLDPRTGWPVDGAQSVSVAAPLCIVAGAHATIALLQGDAGRGYLEASGLPFLWIDRHGVPSGSLVRTMAGGTPP